MEKKRMKDQDFKIKRAVGGIRLKETDKVDAVD